MKVGNGQPLKIAYVTTYDATDIHVWSGLGWYISKCLKEQSILLEYIQLKHAYPLQRRVKSKFYSRLLKKKYSGHLEPYVLKNYAQQVDAKLSNLDVNILFFTQTSPFAYLESDRPIVFWTDAPLIGLINSYPEYSNLCSESMGRLKAAEKSALDRCKLAVFTSEWAAQASD